LLNNLTALCDRGAIRFQLPTNTDISALVAARVESVSRVIAELKRQGVLVKDEDGQWNLREGATV
jgi:hypothetical protein